MKEYVPGIELALTATLPALEAKGTFDAFAARLFYDSTDAAPHAKICTI
jgi:hypothetical protein